MELSLAPGTGWKIETLADLDRYLKAVATAGFKSVSLGMHQMEPALTEPRRFAVVADMLGEHGLSCPDVISLAFRKDPELVARTAAPVFEAVAALGAEWILTLFFTGVNDDSVARFGRLATEAKEVGARLALEFVPGGTVSRVSEADAIVETVGADKVGVLIDTWHFFRGGSSFAELEQIPLEHIAIVQFDDAPAPISDDVMDETTNRRTWPGEGQFDLDRFAGTLKGRGWSGLVSVEVLSEQLRRLGVEDYTRAAYETTAPYWL